MIDATASMTVSKPRIEVRSAIWPAIAFGSVLAIYLCRLKAVQHYSFQTSAYDLGIQANVAWNTAHGYWFWDAVQGLNYLGDHFSPIHLLVAPIYRLWPDAMTLLVIQSAAIGSAATALYLICVQLFGRQREAILLTTLFAFNVYVHRVSAFDFHPVAFGIPIFLWALYCIETRRFAHAIALMCLAAGVEETLIPPIFGLGAYIFLFHRQHRTIGLMVMLAACVYFLAVVKVFMPFFLQEDRLTHIGRFSNLGGGTLSEIVVSILRNPLIPLREMLTPVAKIKSMTVLLMSVWLLPLLAPRQLILLVLPVTLMVIGNFEPQWRLYYQYSAPALPFLFFAAAHGLLRLHTLATTLPYRYRLSGSAIDAGLAVGVAVVVFGFYAKVRHLYYDSAAAVPVEAIAVMVRQVPAAADVCANQHIVPHLANRYRVTMFGRNRSHPQQLCDGRYLVIHRETTNGRLAWPMPVEDYRQAVAEVLQSNAFDVLAERAGVLLLRRKP